MDITGITKKSKLMAALEAMLVVVKKIPEGTECSLDYYEGIQLFFPNDDEISAIYGQEITQAPFDNVFDKRFVCVGGVKVFWLVPKGAGDEPAV